MSVNTESTATVALPSLFSSEHLPDFEREAKAHLDRGVSLLRLDCSAIEYATSSHINALWLALRMCQTHQATLKLESPTAQLIRVLQVMDLYEVFAGAGLDQPAHRASDNPPAAGQTHNLLLGANLNGLRDALAEYLRWMQEIMLSDVDKVELQTVFYEVVANIIEHGDPGDSGVIGFTALTTDEGLRMTFVDPGIEFDPTARAVDIDVEAAARNLQTRGYGLAMISQLVDTMEYRRVDGRRNELTLTRKWRGQL